MYLTAESRPCPECPNYAENLPGALHDSLPPDQWLKAVRGLCADCPVEAVRKSNCNCDRCPNFMDNLPEAFHKNLNEAQWLKALAGLCAGCPDS